MSTSRIKSKSRPGNILDGRFPFGGRGDVRRQRGSRSKQGFRSQASSKIKAAASQHAEPLPWPPQGQRAPVASAAKAAAVKLRRPKLHNQRASSGTASGKRIRKRCQQDLRKTMWCLPSCLRRCEQQRQRRVTNVAHAVPRRDQGNKAAAKACEHQVTQRVYTRFDPVILQKSPYPSLLQTRIDGRANRHPALLD